MNGQSPYRRAEYFRAELPVNNDSGPRWTNILVAASVGGTASGHVYVPQEPELFKYDADGNLTNDGRWTYVWDGENRLIQMSVNTSAGPRYQLNFAYDCRGRRIQKAVAVGGVGDYTNDFLYDGWNLITTLSPQTSILQSFVWGSDLSGSQRGAGGIGGLLARTTFGQELPGAPTTSFYHADGNGDITALIYPNQQLAAKYLYDPFGNMLAMSGPLMNFNKYRFSSKEWEGNAGLYYYGYRFYDPNLQRWPNRDPLGELGFEILRIRNPKVIYFLNDAAELLQKPDPYGFVANSPVSASDSWGLSKDPTCAAKCKQNLKAAEASAVEWGGACLGSGMAGCRESEEAFPICVLTVVSFCAGFEAGLQTAALASYAGCMSGCPDANPCPGRNNSPPRRAPDHNPPVWGPAPD